MLGQQHVLLLLGVGHGGLLPVLGAARAAKVVCGELLVLTRLWVFTDGVAGSPRR